MLCKPVCVFLCLEYYTSGDIVLEAYHFFFLRGHVSHGDILFATEGKWCFEVQHLVWRVFLIFEVTEKKGRGGGRRGGSYKMVLTKYKHQYV